MATSGPFAADIDGPNLLERALDLLRELDPGLRLGAVELEKNLPVAAGLGGGSADAAALLRAVRRANPERAAAIDWHGLAARLGADVPVCLAGVPGADARASATGSSRWRARCRRWPPSSSIRACPCRRRTSSARSPRRSSPSPRASSARGEGTGAAPRPFPDLPALLAYMRARGNDLEPPAIALLPVIADVKAALAAQPGCLLAAMSGSGPTCFGLFADDAAAASAAAALALAHPNWWIAPTRLD